MKLFEYVILISGTFAQEIGEEIQYAKVTKIAHIELEVDGKSRGTIDIGLFGNEVPKTVHNFASLCEGWKNPDGEDDIVLTYDGSKIHRVSPGFIIQGMMN
jgi:peptidylprolyl isomerase